MSATFTKYNKLSEYLASAVIDLEDDTINLALVTSSHTPDADDAVYADIDNELSTGDGYTSGGESLSSKSLSESSGVTTWDADAVTWTSLTATFRYGILYSTATVGAIVKPLIGYILFDDTPGDVAVSGVDFIVQWHVDGIMTIGD